MTLPPPFLASLPLPASGPLTLFFALAIGHFVCDYPMQGTFLATMKNRHVDNKGGAGNLPSLTWVHALTAHSFIHAGAVWLITGSVLLALCEVVLHWLIDFSKCEGWISYHVDQLLHLTCKAVFVLLLFYAVVH